MAKPQLAVEYYTQEEMVRIASNYDFIPSKSKIILYLCLTLLASSPLGQVKFKKPKKRRKIKKRETLKVIHLNLPQS